MHDMHSTSHILENPGSDQLKTKGLHNNNSAWSPRENSA